MSKQLEIQAATTVGEDDEKEQLEGTFYYEPGDDVHEMIDKLGAENVYDFALRSIVIKGQSAVRRELKGGVPSEEIPDVLSDWDPTVQHTATKDPKQTALAAFAKMSPEEQEAFLADLRNG